MKVPLPFTAVIAIVASPIIAHSQTLDRPEAPGGTTTRRGDAIVADLLVLEPITDSKSPFSSNPGTVENVAPDQDTTLLDGLAGFIWVQTGERNKNFFTPAAAVPTPIELQFPDFESDLDFHLERNSKPNGNIPEFIGREAIASSASSQIQVHSVPEPAGMLLSLVGCGLVLGRRHR